ncbi:MAG: hypothetical protein B6D45_07010 [Ignavibacteriales bacterium UTCHB3]|nr:MAG: hypothetical protein B6D45_07010 [Ignavibacteriales bacterium UTCHB3]
MNKTFISFSCLGRPCNISRLYLSFRFLLNSQLLRFFCLSLIFLLFSPYKMQAQEAFNWHIYSNKSELSASYFSDSLIWTGSSGGVYSYNIEDSTFVSFTKAEGLNGSPITSIVADNKNKVWFGSENGMIDVYDKETGSFRRIVAIANSGKTQKRINSLLVSGDTVIVSTDFGVSLINSETLDFYDTYVKFGPLATNTKVNSVFRAGLFYIATEAGLAVQKPGATSLNDPNSWEVYSAIPGFVNPAFLFVKIYKSEIVTGTPTGFFKFGNGTFTPFITETANKKVKNASIIEDDCFITLEYSIPGGVRYAIFKIANDQLASSIIDLPEIFGVYPSPGGLYFAPSKSGLLLLDQSHVLNAIAPNGPGANVFSGLTVDSQGNLFSGSGRDVTGRGFYKFDGTEWTNFNRTNTRILPTDAYYNAFSSSDGNVYLGSYGKGFLRIKPSGELTPFTPTNTPLVGIAADPNFLVVSSLKSDSKGNLWILNFDAGNRKTLNVLTTDSVWHGYQNPLGGNLTNYSTLEIDQNDTKWYASPLRNQLFYYNEKGTFENTADDISGALTESSGLNGQKINSLTLDKRGDLWVGTDLGVLIISSLSAVLQNTSTVKPRVTTVFSLRQQKINSVVVDPVNRKWVGTDAGIFLVNADGTELIAFYDASNSPLLTNEVSVMGSDQKNGKIFIGQTGGLVTFSTRAPAPNQDYSGLFAYPMPYQPAKGGLLTIDGLIKDSEIMILDISGDKIRTLSSPGGRTASWDGRDQYGNFVATGVYFIIASDKDGNTVSKLKIAVIR